MRDALYALKIFLTSLFRQPSISQAHLDYDQYWQVKKGQQMGEANEFQIARGRWIAHRLLDGASVVDVGSGDGAVLLQIMAQKKIDPVGLDVSDYALHFLKSRGIDGKKLDINDPKAIDSIPVGDHVLLLETLEHMQNSEQFLLSIRSKAKKSVFISIPNTGYIHHRLRLLFGRFPLQWRSHPSEHIRFWTVADFRWWIKELKLDHKTEFHCYAGAPLLNQLWPSLFAQGIIAEIKS